MGQRRNQKKLENTVSGNENAMYENLNDSLNAMIKEKFIAVKIHMTKKVISCLSHIMLQHIW